METIQRIREFIQEQFSDLILKEDNFRDQQTFYIKPEALESICQALYDVADIEFRLLADITSVDWYGHDDEKHGRFEVVYNLYSLKRNYRLFIKVLLPGDNPEIASLTTLFSGANWLEREVWDMMGISFIGHPNLTKILTPDDLEGHPLRRDFPLTYEVPVFSWNKDDPPEVIR
jgi:NADH-quinone oxidoreductase subunit C